MVCVTHHNSPSFRDTDQRKCVMCGETSHPPYLYWFGRFAICGKCCADNELGLIADINHVAAAHRVRRLYPGHTLVRKLTKTLTEDD
jgi:hypothetical protein